MSDGEGGREHTSLAAACAEGYLPRLFGRNTRHGEDSPIG
jgi:hypothetical protein